MSYSYLTENRGRSRRSGRCRLQESTAYDAKLPGGQTSMIILNKDAAADVEVELGFGRGMGGVVETETLQAPSLESREAHITTSTKIGSLKQGKCSIIISRATGLRLTVI